MAGLAMGQSSCPIHRVEKSRRRARLPAKDSRNRRRQGPARSNANAFGLDRCRLIKTAEMVGGWQLWNWQYETGMGLPQKVACGVMAFAHLLRYLPSMTFNDEVAPPPRRRDVHKYADGTRPSLADLRNDAVHRYPFYAYPLSGLFELIRDLICAGPPPASEIPSPRPP
jgi:hypothetical protein